MRKTASASSQKVKKYSLKDNVSRDLFWLTIPGIIWFFIFCYLPMAGSVLAFKDFKYRMGIFGSPWVGLKNFEFFFKSNDAVRIISNTIGYNLVFLFAGLVIAVTLALVLHSVGKNTVKFGQSCMLLPYFVSWVIVGFIAMTLFDFESGIFNTLLRSMGMDPVPWYETTGPWRVILVIANLWKNTGQTTLIFYGTLLSISDEIYEAAELDGCTGLNRIFRITLPLLKPAIVTMIILNIGSVMRGDFGLFYYLPNNSGLLYSATDVIDTYVYRALRVNGDVSASAAISFFQSVVGFVMVVATNYTVKKLEPGNEMF